MADDYRNLFNSSRPNSKPEKKEVVGISESLEEYRWPELSLKWLELPKLPEYKPIEPKTLPRVDYHEKRQYLMTLSAEEEQGRFTFNRAKKRDYWKTTIDFFGMKIVSEGWSEWEVE